MDFDALAGSVPPASPEEAPLLREVVELYRLALDGHFHLLPSLQEKGRRLSPVTLSALDRALRAARRSGRDRQAIAGGVAAPPPEHRPSQPAPGRRGETGASA